MREDVELIAMLRDYQYHKQIMNNNTRKKMEGIRIVNAVRQQRQIGRVPSEPVMKPPKRQFVIENE